jgi:predicted glycosyltransferase
VEVEVVEQILHQDLHHQILQVNPEVLVVELVDFGVIILLEVEILLQLLHHKEVLEVVFLLMVEVRD